jgi:hypothetical protein
MMLVGFMMKDKREGVGRGWDGKLLAQSGSGAPLSVSN